MKTKKRMYVWFMAFLLVFSLGLGSAIADSVSVTVKDNEIDGTDMLAKGSFVVDLSLLLEYKVTTTIKQDDTQIYKETVTVGPGTPKVTKTGPDFEYLVKLVPAASFEGEEKLIVKYEKSEIDPKSQFVAKVKVKRNNTGELLYYAKGTIGTTPITEIIGVCNSSMCEKIEPEQEEAFIELKGSSTIFMISDYYSPEFTSVELCYYDAEIERCFDITEHCEITQRLNSDGTNLVDVYFKTFDLPIGPSTLARYKIKLYPLPPASPYAKTSDWLWIFTHGEPLE